MIQIFMIIHSSISSKESSMHLNQFIQLTSLKEDKRDYMMPHTEQLTLNENNIQQSKPVSIDISSQTLKGKSLFSRLFFNWISCVLKYGNQNQIDTNDLPKLHSSHHPKIQFDSLNKQFHQGPLSSRPGITLVKSILRAYKGPLIYIVILALFMTILSMFSPTITHLIISYIKIPNQQKNFMGGLTLLLATAGIAFLKSIIQSHLYFKFAVFGFNLSNTLSLLIYSKALKYPAISHNKYSLPQIINFSQVDAQRMTSMGPQLTAVLYTPLQIVIGIYLMYSYIGISFTAGMATMFALIFITIKLAKRISKINKITNQAKDKRTKITQQILEIIRFIKINTLEKLFYRKVQQKRNEQLQSNKKRAILDVIAVFIFFISCPLIVFLTFYTFIFLGNSIDAAAAFSTIMIFNILQAPLKQLPSSLSNIIQMFSSLKRIEQFLHSEQINESHVILCEEKDLSIRINQGTFGWIDNKEHSQSRLRISNKNMESAIKTTQHQSIQTQQRHVFGDQEQSMDSTKNNIFQNDSNDQNYTPIIKHMNLNIRKGKLVMILGEVGSGKTTLLLGILNQMKSTNRTTIQLNDSVAYSSQRPCIVSGTVKDNILFGLPYDSTKYDEAIYLSALGEDLKQLVKGELTQIGQKGVNLSGGQKMRISLARAIYSNREILLLDDIVSAVDANVAQFIVKVALRGFLREKAILMATHAVKFAQFADQIIIMSQGSIIQQGSFKQISKTEQFKAMYKKLSQDTTSTHNIEENRKISKQQRKVKQTLQSLNEKHSQNKQNYYYIEKAVQNLIIPEEHHRGSIDSSVIKEYINQNGGLILIVATLGTMLGQLIFSIVSSIQIKKWCEDNQNEKYYLYAYILMSFLASLCAFGRSLTILTASFRQGREIHNKIIKSLLYAGLNQFHQRVPLGRIMNRLTKDLRELDESIGNSLTYFLNNSFTLIGSIIICIYGSSLLMVFPVMFVMHLCNKLRKYYMKTQREMIRIQAKTSSPISQGFVSTINGLPTIRAFKMQEYFMNQQINRIQVNKRSRITRQALQSWFAFRLTVLSFLISFLSIAFAIVNSSTEPAITGLLLSYALTLNDDIITHTFSWVNLEARFVAIERIYNFTKIEPEQLYREYYQNWSSIDQGSTQSIKKGEIEFQQISVKYRSDLPDALYRVSFTAEPGQKIGIIGRTGSGKSTIFNTFLKITQCRQGRILIDGVNYHDIPVRDIRNSITVIDQQPVILNSSFRQNLDQKGIYSDAQLNKMLEQCDLHSLVVQNGGLDAKVDNKSLSAGEKQLICICRALLKKSKLVLMDEATANVDLRHDSMIQEIVTDKMKQSTVLIIAHRLSTLTGVDKIIVLEGGQIVEIGSPNDLKVRNGSKYNEMIRRQKKDLLQ